MVKPKKYRHTETTVTVKFESLNVEKHLRAVREKKTDGIFIREDFSGTSLISLLILKNNNYSLKCINIFILCIL